MEQAATMKDTTSPSFDSWLILAQAAANVSLARRFKEEGICQSFVDMVEKEGMALCHFHGFIDRAAIPESMVSQQHVEHHDRTPSSLVLTSLADEQAFFGHDQLPLPCGSVDSAYLTIREKCRVADKVVALGNNTAYQGKSSLKHVEDRLCGDRREG